MSIKYIKRVSQSSSAIEDLTKLDAIQKSIDGLMSARLKSYLNSSSSPLVITLIAGPTDEEISDAEKSNSKVFSIISQKVQSDTNLYALYNRLKTIDANGLTGNLLIAIGLAEYKIEPVETVSSTDEDEDRPNYELKDPKYTLEEVVLSEDSRERLLRALSIIENKKIIFEEWGFQKIDKASKSIICFYGPAGTGKTMTAEAIASYLNKKIVRSSYAQIESKWVGEGAKNLHAIFEFAEQNDAVLFFDEADSFLSTRITATESSSDKHYNRMSNELFQLLEEFNGCVVFATNLLTDVDSVFKSRIIDSIKFDLPDMETRVKLISHMLPSEFPLEEELKEAELRELASSIEGFSGRDIRKSILLSLAGAAVKRVNDGTAHFGFSDIKAGFDEVKRELESLSATESVIPNELAQELVDNQKKNENIIDIAIYAMYCDGNLHDLEIKLIKELSRALLGVEVSEPIEKPLKSMSEICGEAIKGDYIKELLDTAARVVAIDGFIAKDEIEFIKQICHYLALPAGTVDNLISICDQMAASNRLWAELSIN